MIISHSSPTLVIISYVQLRPTSMHLKYSQLSNIDVAYSVTLGSVHSVSKCHKHIPIPQMFSLFSCDTQISELFCNSENWTNIGNGIMSDLMSLWLKLLTVLVYYLLLCVWILSTNEVYHGYMNYILTQMFMDVKLLVRCMLPGGWLLYKICYYGE